MDALRLLFDLIVLVFGGGALWLILLFLFPDKVAQWIALGWRAVGSAVPPLFAFAHRRYVQHDFAGRVNEYTKAVAADAPYLATQRVELKWVGGNVTRDGFFKDDKVILRLRRDDPEDLNFVHASYIYVSTCLLLKAKRYVSQSHRDSVDLFVTGKVLEREKPQVRDLFLRDYMHPRVDRSDKIRTYVDAFEKMHRTGLFYPVLLQELGFLGEKVFGGPRGDQIIAEVNALIEMLQQFAQRKRDQEINARLEGQFCSFALVIVGKPEKVASGGDPYVAYIKLSLAVRRIETIYVLGLLENASLIDDVSRRFSGEYHVHRSVTGRVRLRSDALLEHDRYLVILRRKDVPFIEPSVPGA